MSILCSYFSFILSILCFFLEYFQIDLTLFCYFLVVTLPIASQIGALQKFGALLGRLGTTELAALGLGGGLAATSIAGYIYYYINSYKKMLDDELSKVESYLQRAETEYDAQEGRFNDMLKGLVKR